MLKYYLVINTVLVFLGYHPALVYAFYSSGSQATSNQYYIDNLHLLVPVTLFFASLPNLFIVAYFRYKKKAPAYWT